jgi:hypothetical protein
MARLDLYMQVKPILAGVHRSAIHQRLKNLRRTCSGAFGPVVDQLFFPLLMLLVSGDLPNVKKRPIITFDHIVGIDMCRLVLLNQPKHHIRRCPWYWGSLDSYMKSAPPVGTTSPLM